MPRSLPRWAAHRAKRSNGRWWPWPSHWGYGSRPMAYFAGADLPNTRGVRRCYLISNVGSAIQATRRNASHMDELTLKKAAIRLATLAGRDQLWVLAQLPAAARARIKLHLRMLQGLARGDASLLSEICAA